MSKSSDLLLLAFLAAAGIALATFYDNKQDRAYLRKANSDVQVETLKLA